MIKPAASPSMDYIVLVRMPDDHLVALTDPTGTEFAIFTSERQAEAYIQKTALRNHPYQVVELWL